MNLFEKFIIQRLLGNRCHWEKRISSYNSIFLLDIKIYTKSSWIINKRFTQKKNIQQDRSFIFYVMLKLQQKIYVDI